MDYLILNENYAQKLAEFEIEARITEKNTLFGEIDKIQYTRDIEERLSDPLFCNTYVVVALENDKIVGRCDFTIKGCFTDGFRNAYVDWVYVLKEYRHFKVAQGLIKYMELFLKEHKIEEYFLITAHNEEAQRFYNSFDNFTKETDWILRKEIR